MQDGEKVDRTVKGIFFLSLKMEKKLLFLLVIYAFTPR